ncbi:MAG: hypothetical protein JW729_02490 [Bacteroidales bacterium]|nr:hypothetical protein [Bacteroidales bacterium]
MKLYLRLFSPILFIVLFTFSCTKTEGYGGRASISGTIVEQVYNDDFSLLIDEKKAMDEDVFIIFDNHETVNDKVVTNYEGKFAFEQLFPGNYKIYFYTQDPNSAYQNDIELLIDVDLAKNEQLDLGELIKKISIEYDKGSAKIKGRVYLINYYNSSNYPNLIVKDTSLAQDHDIYLTYGNHLYHDDKIETSFDGTFAFQNLIKGNYRIFLYSEDVQGNTADIVITKEVQITSEFEAIDLGDIYIEQL